MQHGIHSSFTLAKTLQENAKWLFPKNDPTIVTSKVVPSAKPEVFYYVALVVCTRQRNILMHSAYSPSYLAAVEYLQDQLAQSVISKLVKSQGQ